MASLSTAKARWLTVAGSGCADAKRCLALPAEHASHCRAGARTGVSMSGEDLVCPAKEPASHPGRPLRIISFQKNQVHALALNAIAYIIANE